MDERKLKETVHTSQIGEYDINDQYHKKFDYKMSVADVTISAKLEGLDIQDPEALGYCLKGIGFDITKPVHITKEIYPHRTYKGDHVNSPFFVGYADYDYLAKEGILSCEQLKIQAGFSMDIGLTEDMIILSGNWATFQNDLDAFEALDEKGMKDYLEDKYEKVEKLDV